jgi:hypothetical protein
MIQGGEEFSLNFCLELLNKELLLLGHIFVQELFSHKL